MNSLSTAEHRDMETHAANLAGDSEASAFDREAGAERMPAQSDGRWFASHKAWLFIEQAPDTRDDEVQPLLDAVLLDEHDGLLRCLDDWMQTEHDWCPASPETASTPAWQVCLEAIEEPAKRLWFATSDTDKASRHSLSTAHGLRRLPLPDVWQPVVRVSHLEQSAQVVLDTVPLGQGDAQRLQAGALVLMPASFEPIWTVMLRQDGRENGPPLTAELASSTGSLRIEAAVEALAHWQTPDSKPSAADGVPAESGAPIGQDAQAESAPTSEIVAGGASMVITAGSPVTFNSRHVADVWRSGRPANIGPIAVKNGLPVTVRVTEEPGAMIASGLSTATGTLLRLGEGFGVVLDREVPNPGAAPDSDVSDDDVVPDADTSSHGAVSDSDTTRDDH